MGIFLKTITLKKKNVATVGPNLILNSVYKLIMKNFNHPASLEILILAQEAIDALLTKLCYANIELSKNCVKQAWLTFTTKPFETTSTEQNITKVKKRRYDVQTFFTTTIVPEKKFSNDDWSDVRSTTMQQFNNYSERNIDATIIKFLASRDLFKQAQSYINYLKTNGMNLNIGATNAILEMYFFISKQRVLNNSEQEIILDSYKKIKKEHTIMVPTICEHLINILSAIGEWKECVKLLAEVRVLQTPSLSAYSSTIAALFEAHQSDFAWKLMPEALTTFKVLPVNIFESYLKHCVRNYKNDQKSLMENLDKIIHFISYNYVKISHEIATKISDTYTSQFKWTTNFTKLNNSGQCKHCKKQLQLLHLTDQEYNHLKSTFWDRVLVGNDVFVKSTPAEVKRFQDFMTKTAPYDIVLDALNIVYSAGKAGPSLDVLIDILKYFIDDNKKVLLIGRQHMEKWSKNKMQFILQNSNLFLTDDLSQDDPFFLAACLFSGPKTDFVTRDKLRAHKFLLNDEKLRYLFLRWQWEHQWTFFTPNGKSLPSVYGPLKFTPCAQKADGWHIPYEEESRVNYEETLLPSNHWLCLQPARISQH